MNAGLAEVSAFVIGTDLATVNTTCWYWWGWSRKARDVWQDKESGLFAKYVAHEPALIGTPHGTVIFLAEGSTESPAWPYVRNGLKTGRFVQGSVPKPHWMKKHKWLTDPIKRDAEDDD